MVLTFRGVSSIAFPIYPLPSSNWEKADGLFFVEGKVVDDKNMRGDTLGVRRLQTSHDLLPLTKAILDFTGMIKQSKNVFIDSTGIPFIYQKTKMLPLRYKKIKRIDRKVVASVLHLEGEKHPIRIIRPPENGMTWAGVLYYQELPWKLYEYSEEHQKDTRRKV
ncbi:MAG: hypothetical protein VW518_00230 [Burkholderiaceae bacterium]